MNENKLHGSNQSITRSLLRRGGLIILGLGAILTLIGMWSFFSSFASFEPPRYFWCAFLGMPLLFVGGAMAMFGFLGAFQRYVAGESAPVAKDVVNYMGGNTQPGVRSVAEAVTKGIKDGLSEESSQNK